MSRNMINSAIQRYMAENGLDFEQLADVFNASKVVTEYNDYLDLLKNWCHQNHYVSLPDMGSLPGDPLSEEEAKIAAETSPIIAARLYFDRFVMTLGKWAYDNKQRIEAGWEVPLSTIFDRQPIGYTENDIGRAFDEEQFQFYGDQLIFDIVDELCPGFLDEEQQTQSGDEIPVVIEGPTLIEAWGAYDVGQTHAVTLLSIGDFNDLDVEALQNMNPDTPILAANNPKNRMEADCYIAWLVVSKQQYDIARWQESHGMTPLADSPPSIENRSAQEGAWSDRYLKQAARMAGLKLARG